MLASAVAFTFATATANREAMADRRNPRGVGMSHSLHGGQGIGESLDTWGWLAWAFHFWGKLFRFVPFCFSLGELLSD